MTPEEARYFACENKYIGLRNQAYSFLDDVALPFTHKRVNATKINSEATRIITTEWPKHLDRKIAFGWEELLWTLRKSHPRRYEIALWHNKLLCAVAIGRVSKSKQWLSLTHLEASPDRTHGLKGDVVPLVVLAARLYANLIPEEGEMEPVVRILNPVEGAMSVYENAGFTSYVRVTKKCSCLMTPPATA